MLFAPAFMLNHLLQCFVRNDGNPSLSMRAMMTGSLANILLDYIFIFPFDMGIFGAAFATGLSPIISMIVLLPYFVKKRNGFQLLKSISPIALLNSDHIRKITANGVPPFLTEAAYCLLSQQLRFPSFLAKQEKLQMRHSFQIQHHHAHFSSWKQLTLE